VLPEKDGRCADFAASLASEGLVDFSVDGLVLGQSVIPLEALATVVTQELPQIAVHVIIMPRQMGLQLRLVRALGTFPKFRTNIGFM